VVIHDLLTAVATDERGECSQVDDHDLLTAVALD
jgi:hypothetical protein